MVLKRQGENRETVRYKPGRLVRAPFGPVLLSEGEVVDAAHVSAGKLAVIYLSGKGGGFAVNKRFVPVVESGSFGKLGGWRVSRAYGPLPVLEVEGGGTWQGYSCTVATLLELGPDKPRELVSVPIAYDDSGAVPDGKRATTISGRIVHPVPGKSFEVVYSGSKRFTERYVRRGNAYVLAGGGETRMQTC